MKKIILLLPVFVFGLLNAQPKLIGTVHFHGPKYGGSVFRLDLPAANASNIYTFDNSAPHRPTTGVIAGNADWLYGSVNINGTNNSGGLYKVRRNGLGFTSLVNYDNAYASLPLYHSDNFIYVVGGNELKKYDPITNTATTLANDVYSRNLCIDSEDWIYYQSVGNLYKRKTDGTGDVMLHSFALPGDGYDAVGITEVPSGLLFGIQRNGGVDGGGVIFSIEKDGSNFTVVHDFENTAGIIPGSKLIYMDGKLFGTTSSGGDFGSGTLYSIKSDGTQFRVLHHFTGGSSNATAAGNIAISSNGRVFGNFTTPFWDGNNYMRHFKIDTSGENFQALGPGTQRDNGLGGQDILLLDDEDIYSISNEYGKHDGGVLNYSDSTGSGPALYHFGLSANGFRSTGGVIKGSDGKLYGTNAIGGTSGNGTIFSVNENGSGFVKLHEFTNAQGYEPSGKLLEASDGKLYGACRSGITNSGMLFRIDKNGSNFQVILQFTGAIDGYSPVGSLVEDASGMLYGTTFYGSLGGGTIFRVSKNGTGFVTLRSFNASAPDLSFPYNGVVLSKGYLYGFAGYGGTESKGGIFRIKTDGSGFQVLHEFTTAAAGGALPVGRACIASNGKLYGTTNSGGTNDEGTLFSIDTTGNNFMVHKNFSASIDGAYPWGGILQASDGLLYGTTQLSSITPSNNSAGTLFRMNLDGTGFTVITEFNSDLIGQGASSTLIDLNGIFSLPVQWLEFTAIKKPSEIQLNWKTAAEYNCERFEIERSENGITFSNIGTVQCTNRSNGANYSFSDLNPMNGTNYYKLKQIDLDGTHEYSRIIKTTIDARSVIRIFPNPVQEYIQLSVPSSVQIRSAFITDMAGRMLKSITPIQNVLPTNGLKAGNYILQLETNSGTQLLRFIKQ